MFYVCGCFVTKALTFLHRLHVIYRFSIIWILIYLLLLKYACKLFLQSFFSFFLGRRGEGALILFFCYKFLITFSFAILVNNFFIPQFCFRNSGLLLELNDAVKQFEREVDPLLSMVLSVLL